MFFKSKKPEVKMVSAKIYFTEEERQSFSTPMRAVRHLRESGICFQPEVKDVIARIGYRLCLASCYKVTIVHFTKSYKDLFEAAMHAPATLSLCEPDLAPFLLIKAKQLFQEAKRLPKHGYRSSETDFGVCMKAINGDVFYWDYRGDQYDSLRVKTLHAVDRTQTRETPSYWVYAQEIG
jgi:hypothetical protein